VRSTSKEIPVGMRLVACMRVRASRALRAPRGGSSDACADDLAMHLLA
jgi:hypothetical protein